MSGWMRLLGVKLTICAAGHGVTARDGTPVVCGLPPGHGGKLHRDIERTLVWPVRKEAPGEPHR